LWRPSVGPRATSLYRDQIQMLILFHAQDRHRTGCTVQVIRQPFGVRVSRCLRNAQVVYKLSHKHFQRTECLNLTVNDVNQEHRPHRHPVGGARTTVSSATSGGPAWSAVARYASGAERCFLGFCAPVLLGTICRVVILPIRLAIVASNSGSASGCSPGCSRNWRKTYAIEGSSI